MMNISPKSAIEEARKVLWHKGNPRPIGELLDEGYLDEASLRWAASNAYDPTLKRAAQILLDNLAHAYTQHTDQSSLLEEPLRLKISLEQARNTPWPMHPFKGQLMGSLVEKQKITLRDLGFLAENAWDERVKQASIALMSVRLHQALEEPISSKKFIHVVRGGRSFSARRQYFLTLTQGVLGGGLLGFLLRDLFLSIEHFQQAQALNRVNGTPAPSLLTAIVAILIFVFLLFLLWGFLKILDLIMNHLDKRIKHHRKGEEGEQRVVDVIQQVLDGEWWLFRNILIPGRNKADLDAILVGPTGIWVLEIKNFSNNHRNIGERWQYEKNGKWYNSRSSPSQQAQNNAARLGNFLKVNGLQQWVKPILVWANTESTATAQNNTVPIWTLDRLRDELGNLWEGAPIPTDKRDQIVEKLTSLCPSDSESGDEESKQRI